LLRRIMGLRHLERGPNRSDLPLMWLAAPGCQAETGPDLKRKRSCSRNLRKCLEQR
jgi:hypothetical protein